MSERKEMKLEEFDYPPKVDSKTGRTLKGVKGGVVEWAGGKGSIW